MAKSRGSVFFCNECGFESAKWLGQCPSCKVWNSMEEMKFGSEAAKPGNTIKKMLPRAVCIDDIEADENVRYTSGLSELDRVLGGGIVAGSVVLIGGDPGIGKSTILLQVCRNLAATGGRILYISGEESLKQIKLRTKRIGDIKGELKFLCETDTAVIENVILSEQPQVVVIDSIQTMYKPDVSSSSGSITQVRECTSQLMRMAKSNSIAVFLVGHVTKEGQIAGPRVLEHMVDSVLYFEGERFASYRILRGVKNRFGSTNEIGVFEMYNDGLKEVANPSEYMLSGRPEGASGAAVACLMEGSRPILLETQALVTPTLFGMPRRTSVGTDVNRVNLLMAVIEKRCRLQMSRYDAYINIAGGMKMNEPALDLPIVMALVSSLKDRSIDDDTVIFGEVGLAGEIRAVNMAQLRIKEAKKLGFKTCILPAGLLNKVSGLSDMNLIGVSSIREAIDLIK